MSGSCMVHEYNWIQEERCTKTNFFFRISVSSRSHQKLQARWKRILNEMSRRDRSKSPRVRRGTRSRSRSRSRSRTCPQSSNVYKSHQQSSSSHPASNVPKSQHQSSSAAAGPKNPYLVHVQPTANPVPLHVPATPTAHAPPTHLLPVNPSAYALVPVQHNPHALQSLSFA